MRWVAPVAGLYAMTPDQPAEYSDAKYSPLLADTAKGGGPYTSVNEGLAAMTLTGARDSAEDQSAGSGTWQGP